MADYRLRIGPNEGDPEIDVRIDDPSTRHWLGQTLDCVVGDVGGLQMVTIMSEGPDMGKSALAELGHRHPPSLLGRTAFA